MNAAVSVMVDPDCLAALATYLAKSVSNLSLGQAAACAIRDWLARVQQATPGGAGSCTPDSGAAHAGMADPGMADPGMANPGSAEPSACPGARGYRWKCLFLPEMTQIRMLYKGRTYHAQVIGDEIVHDGQCVSPRQMTLKIAGDGRNAWRDLMLRFPGERTWSHGAARRNALLREAAPPAGITGATGVTGGSGNTGSTRSTGSAESTGSTGSTASTASTGSTGSIASTGRTGSIASTGRTGSTASTGRTGSIEDTPYARYAASTVRAGPTGQAEQPGADTIAATVAMSQVLTAVRELLDRFRFVHASSDDTAERRTERLRRTSDLMADACRND